MAAHGQLLLNLGHALPLPLKDSLRPEGDAAFLFSYCKKPPQNCLSPKRKNRWISNEIGKVVDYFGHPH